jgi:putative Holliday junction resolvase
MEENKILTFTDEDGENIDFEVIDCFEMDEKRYIALAEPETEENADKEAFVYIMEIVSESDEEDILVQIEDEKVLDKAFEVFRERCEEDYDFAE